MPQTNPSDDAPRRTPMGAEPARVSRLSRPREVEVPCDVVDEAGMASFPASDPPAWNRVHPGGPVNEDAIAGG